MAFTHFLLQSNFNSIQHLSPFRSVPTKWSCAENITLKKNCSPCCINTFPKFNMNCFTLNHNNSEAEKGFGENNLKKVATETGINEVIWRSVENVMKALQVCVKTAVLLGLLLLFDHQHYYLALAATGGRMGGHSRSSCGSSSSSASSSYSSSSRSSIPSYSSSGSYHTQISSPVPMNVANEDKPDGFSIIMSLSILLMLGLFLQWCNDHKDDAKTSVLKLQVGSLGTGRLLQKDLNRIAESADTSTSKGLNNALQDMILALLRHSEYCISGYSSVNVKKSVREGEKLLDQISIEERAKFDEETLINVNNIRKKVVTSQSSNGLCNEYIVVTIIVVALGVTELPPIKSNAHLKKALQQLASISSSNIVGVEVLWTPQKEDDSLTEQEMLEDYPLLHPI